MNDQLHLLQVEDRFVFALQILSAGNFDLAKIISRDHMVQKFLKNLKTKRPRRPFKSGRGKKIWPIQTDIKVAQSDF